MKIKYEFDVSGIKCHACESLGLTSTVEEEINERISTCEAYLPTNMDTSTDEEGYSHVHNRQQVNTVFRCSEGHRFTCRLPNKCSRCGWIQDVSPNQHPIEDTDF